MHSELPPFRGFHKIPRLNRDVVITEKIDGTNGLVHVTEDGRVLAGSKNRWITPDADNFGFASWVAKHTDDLATLGPGSHFGEWWGLGIQRGYGLTERRFSLFNTGRWNADNTPGCCHVVPVLYEGPMDMEEVRATLEGLRGYGSRAEPGWFYAEGVILYHTAARASFKVLLEGDDLPKSKADGVLDDGYGNTWVTCGPGCAMEIVRPGKVQCTRCKV